jgi:ribonuclease HI
VTSELVVECLNALSALAGLNKVTVVWVPGYSGNEEADKLARQASAMPLTGPEPALGDT